MDSDPALADYQDGSTVAGSPVLHLPSRMTVTSLMTLVSCADGYQLPSPANETAACTSGAWNASLSTCSRISINHKYTNDLVQTQASRRPPVPRPSPAPSPTSPPWTPTQATRPSKRAPSSSVGVFG